MLENNHEKKAKKKYAGILVHPTSFPGPYGIGDLGKGAYHFIDFLANAGLNLWQVLPLGHTGFGDSPYQPFSAFAGQPLIIDLDALKKYNLLSDSDFADMPVWDPIRIDYGTLIQFKTEMLKLAYERFIDESYEDALSADTEQMEAYAAFIKDSSWLADYSLFMAGKDYHNGMPWYIWEDSLKAPTKRASVPHGKKKTEKKKLAIITSSSFYFIHNGWLLKLMQMKWASALSAIPLFSLHGTVQTSGAIRSFLNWIPKDIQ